MARRRRAHEVRGEDPDDWAVIMDDVNRELQKSLLVLADACEREGIDVSEVDGERHKPEAVEQIQRLGLELVMAAEAIRSQANLLRDHRPQPADVARRRPW